MVPYCELFRFKMSRTVVSDGIKKKCERRVNRETATSFTSLHLTVYVRFSNQNDIRTSKMKTIQNNKNQNDRLIFSIRFHLAEYACHTRTNET